MGRGGQGIPKLDNETFGGGAAQDYNITAIGYGQIKWYFTGTKDPVVKGDSH